VDPHGPQGWQETTAPSKLLPERRREEVRRCALVHNHAISDTADVWENPALHYRGAVTVHNIMSPTFHFQPAPRVINRRPVLFRHVPMTADEHTERITRLYDGVWNGENPAVADELVAPEYYIHDREIADEIRGPELYKQLASGTREMFPDMDVTIHDTVATAEKVAVRWTMTGTHTGPGFGMEPTGETVEFDAIEINRFEAGKLRETWTQSDQIGLMQQLGALSSE
jgi:steroid delta-isomerase-like uncharacterized protein